MVDVLPTGGQPFPRQGREGGGGRKEGQAFSALFLLPGEGFWTQFSAAAFPWLGLYVPETVEAEQAFSIWTGRRWCLPPTGTWRRHGGNHSACLTNCPGHPHPHHQLRALPCFLALWWQVTSPPILQTCWWWTFVLPQAPMLYSPFSGDTHHSPATLPAHLPSHIPLRCIYIWWAGRRGNCPSPGALDFCPRRLRELGQDSCSSGHFPHSYPDRPSQTELPTTSMGRTLETGPWTPPAHPHPCPFCHTITQELLAFLCWSPKQADGTGRDGTDGVRG